MYGWKYPDAERTLAQLLHRVQSGAMSNGQLVVLLHDILDVSLPVKLPPNDPLPFALSRLQESIFLTENAQVSSSLPWVFSMKSKSVFSAGIEEETADDECDGPQEIFVSWVSGEAQGCAVRWLWLPRLQRPFMDLYRLLWQHKIL